MVDAEEALKDTRLKVPDEVTDEKCELCGRNLVVKTSRFGKFLACPGYPGVQVYKADRRSECRAAARSCGSAILKRKSKRGYAYYACERGAECGFMTWDVPTDQDCPVCGQTMFKRSGRGAMKPFCIESRVQELPAGGQARLPQKARCDRRGGGRGESDAEPAELREAAEEEKAAKKTAAKKPAEKKPAAKKTAAKKAAAKKPAAKKPAAKKAAAKKTRSPKTTSARQTKKGRRHAWK